MRKPIRTLVAGALVACGLAVITSPASAQEETVMATGPSGSTAYIHGNIIADAANGYQSDYRLTAQTTGGYKDSLSLLMGGDAELAMNSLVEVENAYNTRGAYEELPDADKYKALRKVFTFGVVPHNLFVRSDSGIDSLEDIKGKKININTPAGFTHGLNLDLLEAAGISLDDFDAGMIPTGKVFEQVQNGVFDGGLHLYDVGYARAVNLAQNTDMKWIGFDQDLIDKLNEKYGGLLPAYTIPANAYRGQTEPIPSFGAPQVIIAREDSDEELVYQFTKAFWEQLESIGAANIAFQAMNLDIGAQETSVPYHPGAARYFKERGLDR